MLFKQSRTKRKKWRARPLRVLLVKVNGPGVYKLRLDAAGSLKIHQCRKKVHAKKKVCRRDNQRVSKHTHRQMRGVPGAEGPQGPQGISGVPGAEGAQGLQGAPGPQGAPGLRGPEGLQGIPGPRGPEGAQGVPGQEGPEGPQGIPGTVDLSSIEVIPSSSRYFYIADESMDGIAILPAHRFTDDAGAAVTHFPEETSNSYNHLFINGMLQEGQLFSVDSQTLTLHLGNDTVWAGTPVILEHVALKLEVGSL
ncbi:DUF4183 domain-containing protein [Paenibacillus antibioticophila]|nr:DUF4183 domain-containing protein [Paenibacillus antibioticophila]